MTVDTDKLKTLALAASPGPWQWWTSNSTLRLTGADGRDGGVLHGYVHAGVGDVSCSAPNRAFIEAACPATVLALIAEVERLRAELASGAARTGDGTVEYGCHCDLDPGTEPDDCVIGTSRASDCNYAHRHAVKEACEYWQPIKFDAAIEKEKA